jgi:phage/plasmid-like protein (TIGR03299 family)
MSSLFESGMFVGTVPWHFMGNMVPADTRFSVSEGLIAAGMNWDVYTRHCGYMANGRFVVPMEPEFDKDGEKIGEYPRNVYTCRRMLVDGQEQEQELGIVGGKYNVVQNADMFKWFQPYLDKGEAYLHTAGSLNGGKWVWVLAKLNRDPVEIAKDDFIEKFLLLSSSHDGSLSVRVGFTPIRVVCANTLAAAHNDKQSKLLKLRHTKMVHAGLEAVHDIIDTVNADFEATAEQFKMLAKKGINQADLVKFVLRVMVEDDPKKLEGKISTKMQNIVQSICERIESKTNSMPSIRGSWWAAYNAMTEHLSHAAGGEAGKIITEEEKANNRVASLWFGKNGKLNNLALKIAVEMAA